LLYLIIIPRCYGAASAKDRLDCVIRDAINQGSIPGPRYLANGKEIARRGGELTPGITAFADGELKLFLDEFVSDLTLFTPKRPP
jgi:hypothetical protein